MLFGWGTKTTYAKKALLLTIFLFLGVIFATAQNSQGTAVGSAQEGQTAATNIYTETDESALLLDDDTSEGAALGQSRRRSFAGTYIVVILFLAALIALAWWIRRVLKRTAAGGGEEDDTFLRRVASLSLGGGKSVQIVTLLDEAFLLGVSDGGVQFLSKIEDKELVNAMNVYADKRGNTARPKSFADVLELFVPKKSAGKTTADVSKAGQNVFENASSQNIIDSLKRQSKRLSEEE